MKFLEMEWYWWLLLIGAVAVVIPVKVKLMKWWVRKQREQKNNDRNRWGEEE
ncbi:hypothetical protein [uncultured Robinsoniella sp.]|uniref:hypothetical protein n=1 Tax=uncultured Robinsoniella sp. TaxID=904190 RepID=UPI00374E68AF